MAPIREPVAEPGGQPVWLERPAWPPIETSPPGSGGEEYSHLGGGTGDAYPSQDEREGRFSWDRV